ncbi:uncharacterized protein ASPGLDRAFT_38234 [Aspergillus glaucus CBS 516.65]|uniref:Uncharacterized protein n=1 Tax=Aspergillus glaucus CBS 516.65 TaxID=1160497 RepID=A0A1L9VC54_ASPGL|nr:hypothetical protein ASPGLDRAFT_38234 [Aspergillus glaucus CBS 516.65]OJJ81469.1 hypothetical protein ASPGLDRAFT_38234 [Aspergillus glaucus CBS 516.65]
MRYAYQVLPPILAGLALDRAANGGKGTSADAIEWYHQLAGKRKYDEVIAQVGLAHAAIHTTEDLPFKTLTQLAEHPEVIPQVQKEIVHAISTYEDAKPPNGATIPKGSQTLVITDIRRSKKTYENSK